MHWDSSSVSPKSSRCSDPLQAQGWIVQPLCFRGIWFCFLSEPNTWHFWDDEETEGRGDALIFSLVSVQPPEGCSGLTITAAHHSAGSEHCSERLAPPQPLCALPWLRWVTGYLMALGESDWHGQECSYTLSAPRNQLCVQFLDVVQG